MRLLKTILTIVILSSVFTLAAQEQNKEFKKNSITGDFGTWLFYIKGDVSYQRIYTKSNIGNVNVYFGYKFSAGISESFENGTYVQLSANHVLLTGENKSHFELNTGINAYVYDLGDKQFSRSASEIFNLYSPNVDIGYRYQNMQKGGFTFRTGIGWPTGLYAGLGWTF